MSNINYINRHEKSWHYALEIIRVATGETVEEQKYRLLNDQSYYNVIHHIASLYLAIENNRDFKAEINDMVDKSIASLKRMEKSFIKLC